MARNWTNETDAQADEFFATLSGTEIRRRQDLTSQQIAMAHAHDEIHEDALHDLRRQEDALCRAMLARC